MEFLMYAGTALISYLGLLMGCILIKIAPEEQRPGKCYFILFKKILFILITAILFLFYNEILAIVVLLFLSLLFATKKIAVSKPKLIYAYLGIVFFASSLNQNIFLLESTLIFLFGLPTASLLFNKNNYVEILRNNSWFFLPVIVLYVTTFLF